MNTITSEVHERADHLLCKAETVVNLILSSTNSADAKVLSNAAWAAADMIEEARELYGKF